MKAVYGTTEEGFLTYIRSKQIETLIDGFKELSMLSLNAYIFEHSSLKIFKSGASNVLKSYEYHHVDSDLNMIFIYKFDQPHDNDDYRFSITVHESYMWPLRDLTSTSYIRVVKQYLPGRK